MSKKTENPAAELGRKGGQARSKLKVDAARINGAKGGRPIKMTKEQETRCREAYLLASRVTGISEDQIRDDRKAYRQYQREWAISEAARLATNAWLGPN